MLTNTICFETIRIFIISLFVLPGMLFSNVAFCNEMESHEVVESNVSSTTARKKKRALKAKPDSILYQKAFLENQGSSSTFTSDDKNNWFFVIHAESLDPRKRDVSTNLAKLIIESGGGVTVIGDYERTPHYLNEIKLEDRKYIVHLDGFNNTSRWVQNYWGFISNNLYEDGKYTIFDYDLNQPDRSKDTHVRKILSDRFRIPLVDIGLKLQGGAIVSLDRGSVLVSRRVIHDNAPLTPSEIHSRLKKLGIDRIIWIQQLPGDFSGHSDICAAYINGHIIVPQILPEAIQYSSDKQVAQLARDNLDRLALMCNGLGYNVLRLAMPVPNKANEHGLIAYYTPVNWLAVRGCHGPNYGKTTVIIPVPDTAQTDSDLTQAYIEMNQLVFEKLGLRAIYVNTTLPEFGGGFKCIINRVPLDLLDYDLDKVSSQVIA